MDLFIKKWKDKEKEEWYIYTLIKQAL
jgi:hypothetical protein